MADAEEPDEVIAAQADKAVERAVEDILEAGADQADEAVELVDPEEAKSRESIINSIIERRAKKPNYTCGRVKAQRIFRIKAAANTRGCLGPEFFELGRSKHSIVFRPG